MTEDFRAEELIYMMKKIGLDLAAQIDCCLKNDEISGIQVYFLVYLLRHHSEGPTLRSCAGRQACPRRRCLL